ncbi:MULTISPECIES: hypothetical protein [Mesonia]|nr:MULTISPECIES: hypothetical protein [Mesonia]MAN26725.1 hypothetical protein [Mesonia sp.]MAQ40429.1 hypothetical protein [Mesonia sp.]MBJ98050.1 hypothetical protein [Flavobacteriaceae bacterium]
MKLFLILTIVTGTTVAHSQESKIEVTINPEISMKVLKSTPIAKFDIYRVSKKKIEYYQLVDGQVPTKKAIRLNGLLEKYRPEFDAYHQTLEDNKNKRQVIDSILGLANLFLDTKGRYSNKEGYLIKAQKIADYNNIIVTTTKENKAVFQQLAEGDNNGYSKAKEREIVLYSKDERTRKSEVEIYINSITETKEAFKEPQKTYDYRQYIELEKELDSIPKTTLGKVNAKTPKFVLVRLNH